MNQNWKRNNKLALLLITVVLIFALSACAGRTAHALDYTLEDELYSGVTGEPETTVEPVESAVPEESEQTEPLAENTPTPEATQATEPSATPDGTDATEDPEATPIPADARLTILVQDADGNALSGARVKLSMDGEFLYSEVTGAEGSVFWLLPTGHDYRANAEKDGYRESGNVSVTNLSEDAGRTIVLEKDEAVPDETEPTPTPVPVPTIVTGKVTITAVDTAIPAGDTAFVLIEGVSARTEAGEPVAVWVVDDGGFCVDIAGDYRVTYGAMQEGELITAVRVVHVTGESDEEVDGGIAEPTGSSAERYEILLAYRNEICDALTAKIADLTQQYNEKVQSVTEGETNVRIMAQSAAENDTDVESAEPAEFSPVQEALVKNWSDVLATFIAESSLDVDHPLDLMQLRSISLDGLDEVFWRMNPVSVIRMDGVTNVILDSKSYDEMTSEYGMDAKRTSFLYELMQPEFQRTFASLTGNAAFLDATDADLEQIRAALPADLDVGRKDVVETAFSLVGKVTYLWGGKYNKLGWNEQWGLPCSVRTEQNGESVVVERTGGLDCSGFVSWVFINATGDTSVVEAIGNGSSSQWSHSTAIGWDEGKPGDLAFYSVPGEKQFNHVGVIVSVDDDGSYLVAHCSSRKNGVVVTEAWSTGFRYIRKPVLFE